MSTHHGGNDGNNLPPDGDRTPDPEFPELPAEWGDVTIPDDPAELDSEAEQIREELAREQREGRPVREPTGSPAATGSGEPSIGVPLLIMSVAVMITLVSLFAMAWSGSGSVAPDQPGQAADAPSELPPITLLDSTSRQVALTAQTPVAIMLVEECECDGLMSATMGAAPSGVTVAAIGHQAPSAPALEPGDPEPLLLGDPNGIVRSQLGLDPATGDATVVLVDQGGQITATHPVVTSFAQIQGDLTDLSS